MEPDPSVVLEQRCKELRANVPRAKQEEIERIMAESEGEVDMLNKACEKAEQVRLDLLAKTVMRI